MNNDSKIFSLNKFRKIKDNSFDNKNTCLKYSEKYGKNYITNPRFNKFDQTYFTAGDLKDLNKYALLPLRYVYSDDKIKKIEKDKPTIFKLYKNIDYNSIENTLFYMFNKFKKGILVIIKDNKLITFLPFSNANYHNKWIKQTYFTEDEKKLLKEEKDINKIKNKLNENIITFKKDKKYHPRINFNREEWYANNCLFRNDYPSWEGELNINVYRNMIETLLKERVIKDVEFFINDRDFPLLKKDYTEPYNHLYDGSKIKIEKEYQFKKMAPIFSKSITNDFADILLPTNDDWVMASNRYFTSKCSNEYHKNSWDKINMDWKSKNNICVFRGSATGCGLNIENNMRLKAADLSVDWHEILDAKITNWKARMRKYEGNPIDVIDPSKFRFKLEDKLMNNVEKSNYKYILNIDGYVSAFRLGSELNMNSVVLIVNSEYKLWFSYLLEEYVHFVPVKEDLSDLIDRIKWCIDNDSLCKKIANNALKFYEKYLTKDAILNYMQTKLLDIHINKNFKNLLNVKKKKVNIAIISCFRDKGDGKRDRERRIFIQLMNKLLEPYCKFKIYIIEQSKDGNPFNIGKLKNIGFEIAQKENKYDNYIFSDIDTIPDYDLMNYMLDQFDSPLSLACRGTRYSSKNENIKKPFLGALIQFTADIFTKINGYPNNFWGWGGEDDSFFNRLFCNNIKNVYYPKEGSIIDFEENEKMTFINNIKAKYNAEIKDMLKYEKLYTDLKLWNKNGINNLNYKVLEKNEINPNTIQIKVDLLKEIDEKKYSYLYPKESKDYLQIQKEVKKSWYKVNIKYI